MINDKCFHGGLLRFEAQPELLLQGGKKGGATWVRCQRGSVARRSCHTGTRNDVGTPVKFEIVLTGQTGPIENGTIHRVGKINRQHLHGNALADYRSPPSADRRSGFWFSFSELWPVLRHNQCVYVLLFTFAVN